MREGVKGKEHYYEAKAPSNKHVDQYVLGWEGYK